MNSEKECPCCVDYKNEIVHLNTLLSSQEKEIKLLKSKMKQPTDLKKSDIDEFCTLNNNEIMRYSRQIIMPEIGVRGQLCLKKSSVLIVGAGGLGCPVGVYLAAAGVGKIGIVDYDEVEISNLHRQISHTEHAVGVPKSISLATSMKAINSSVDCVPHNVQLNSKNIKSIATDYDIVVDASDNLPTRYLLNDCCVLLRKPLVSGSALRFEGQLTVYNVEDGPCYRCLYPSPPSPESTTNCSEGGVVGPVTGVIGSLQALEVIKIIVGLPLSFHNKMLHFDGEYGKFRIFNLRKKNPHCDICSDSPKMTDLIDYEMFCNVSATDKVQNISILLENDRISCMDYKKLLSDKVPHILLDVRPRCEVDICSFSNCINIPMSKLKAIENLEVIRNNVQQRNCQAAYVICRRGNDSQKAVEYFKEVLKDSNLEFYDIIGGFQAWHNEIDQNFPLY